MKGLSSTCYLQHRNDCRQCLEDFLSSGHEVRPVSGIFWSGLLMDKIASFNSLKPETSQSII